MKIFYEIRGDQIQCPHCWEMLEWNGSDLQIDIDHDDMYYMVCPICNERMYVKRTETLDTIYNESNT